MNGNQCRAARALARLSVRELAIQSGVSASTIVRLEDGKRIDPENDGAIARALHDLGIQILNPGDDAEGEGAAVRPDGWRPKLG